MYIVIVIIGNAAEDYVTWDEIIIFMYCKQYYLSSNLLVRTT
jgi:hypothetical protein